MLQGGKLLGISLILREKNNGKCSHLDIPELNKLIRKGLDFAGHARSRSGGFVQYAQTVVLSGVA